MATWHLQGYCSSWRAWPLSSYSIFLLSLLHPFRNFSLRSSSFACFLFFRLHRPRLYGLFFSRSFVSFFTLSCSPSFSTLLAALKPKAYRPLYARFIPFKEPTNTRRIAKLRFIKTIAVGRIRHGYKLNGISSSFDITFRDALRYVDPRGFLLGLA